MSKDFDALITELESTAGRLRSGELDAAEAAALVERCAELAGEVGAELERQGRIARHGEAGEAARGQERLL